MDELEQLQQLLSQPLPEIPTWYLYDPVGIRLFEQITQLPEYYPTRIETALLAEHGGPLVRQLGVRRLAELGSGSSQKIVPLLKALPQGSYTLFDVAGDAVRNLARQFAAKYPKLSVQALQGNFYTDLHLLGPGGGPRLLLLLGNTFANLAPDQQHRFLDQVQAHMAPEDAFLIGVDVVKDPAIIEAAYNDALGVSAAFTLNALTVVNHRLGTTFVLEDWQYWAFYDPTHQHMDVRVRAVHDCVVQVGDKALSFAKGSSIRVEVSARYTRSSLQALVAPNGFVVDRWLTDADQWFALAVLCPEFP